MSRLEHTDQVPHGHESDELATIEDETVAFCSPSPNGGTACSPGTGSPPRKKARNTRYKTMISETIRMFFNYGTRSYL